MYEMDTPASSEMKKAIIPQIGGFDMYPPWGEMPRTAEFKTLILGVAP